MARSFTAPRQKNARVSVRVVSHQSDLSPWREARFFASASPYGRGKRVAHALWRACLRCAVPPRRAIQPEEENGKGAAKSDRRRRPYGPQLRSSAPPQPSLHARLDRRRHSPRRARLNHRRMQPSSGRRRRGSLRMPSPLHVATTPPMLHRGSSLTPAELVVVFVLYAPIVSGRASTGGGRRGTPANLAMDLGEKPRTAHTIAADAANSAMSFLPAPVRRHRCRQICPELVAIHAAVEACCRELAEHTQPPSAPPGAPRPLRHAAIEARLRDLCERQW